MKNPISIEELVIGYCRESGALVEPPAFGIYEVLLPDAVAHRLQVTPHQHWNFSQDSQDAEYLFFGHPVVEKVVDEIRLLTANANLFINNVRVDKPNLFEAVEKAIGISNAKFFRVNGAIERPAHYHYVCFNFKVSLIADEKREMLATVYLHLQGGYAVSWAEINKFAIFEEKSTHPNYWQAEPFWQKGTPLSEEVLSPLLERAVQAVPTAMGTQLQQLEKRLQHFLTLDQARLTDYYSGLLKDLEKRLARAEPERQSAMQAKMLATQNEMQFKLQDVAQKYHLRIQLELLNLAVFAQPKLELPVEISKRNVSVRRMAVWDPLLHIVEPMICDVCGQPGKRLTLCENGHLAHAECLAPQCVDCKRSFCNTCRDQVLTCVVCDRPVCVQSHVHCPTCQRTTCQTHKGECHAEQGQPRKVGGAVIQASPTVPAKSVIQATPTLTSAKPKPSAKKSIQQKESATIEHFMDVVTSREEIFAEIRTNRGKIAKRTWFLGRNGINVICTCDNPTCKVSDFTHRLQAVQYQKVFLARELDQFASEFQVKETNVRYFRLHQTIRQPEKTLKTPGMWQDEPLIQELGEKFDRLKD
ncbi:MAG TPA: hypothetical protein PK299_09485 [Anaerolineales bacterium]|nr:hypothetical protein [Anaerolineales bacterium]